MLKTKILNIIKTINTLNQIMKIYFKNVHSCSALLAVKKMFNIFFDDLALQVNEKHVKKIKFFIIML